jgi:hypothetical protein
MVKTEIELVKLVDIYLARRDSIHSLPDEQVVVYVLDWQLSFCRPLYAQIYSQEIEDVDNMLRGCSAHKSWGLPFCC